MGSPEPAQAFIAPPALPVSAFVQVTGLVAVNVPHGEFPTTVSVSVPPPVALVGVKVAPVKEFALDKVAVPEVGV